MTTSSPRTRSTLVSEAFHADEMLHKHGPAPVSEKCVNESRCAEEMQAPNKFTHLYHPPQKKQTSGLTFTVRFEVAVYRWRLAFSYVHWSAWRGLGAGAKAHVGWRGHLFSERGKLHCAWCHGHVVGLLNGF